MFKPLLLVGHSEHKLKLDDAAINDIILSRKSIRLSERDGDTFTEDSYLPKKDKAVAELLERVDEVIQKEVHPLMETYNEWAHILEPNESTMFHSHTRKGRPPGISWVYYSKVPKNSGNLVFTFEAAAHRVIQEVVPEVGKLVLFPDYVPHFTKKNISKDTRISVSGNAEISDDNFSKIDGMHNLLNYVGIFQG